MVERERDVKDRGEDGEKEGVRGREIELDMEFLTDILSKVSKDSRRGSERDKGR